MSKISVDVQQDACFVYHMLSVAQCGYDNAYGAAYRHLHDPEDLATLQAYESLLTVSGGEHCGELYWPLLAMPARGERPAPESYRLLLEQPGNEHAEAIQIVCRAMLRAYPVYMDQVYPLVRPALTSYAAQTAAHLGDFTDRAESLVGCQLPVPQFHALLVDSVAWGPECIDISDSQDIFGIERTPAEEAMLIEHEFVIYLLKAALAGTTAFQRGTWAFTESLASHYLAMLLGDAEVAGFFPMHQAMRERCRQLHEQHPFWSPRELYQAISNP